MNIYYDASFLHIYIVRSWLNNKYELMYASDLRIGGVSCLYFHVKNPLNSLTLNIKKVS